jgi:outer membrane protein assembly factor BamB
VRRPSLSILAVFLVLASGVSSARAQSLWTHFGSSASHSPGLIRPGPTPKQLSLPSWVVNRDENAALINFNGQAGVVASYDYVYALGSIGSGASQQFRLFAIDRRKAYVAWSALVLRPVSISFSTPVYDARRRTVSVAAGAYVFTFDANTGAYLWSTELAAPVVNASPVVTSDLGFNDRMFITDFDAGAGQGALYCINIARYHAALNPYHRGDIVWTTPMHGSVGNTPAYDHGRLFVASAGGPDDPGAVRAYDARARTPALLWATPNPARYGFFGGVSVRSDGERSFVFAASYNFNVEGQQSNLLKIDASNGVVYWSTPCERTSSTPIPLPDGRIVLAAGVVGTPSDSFGSAPRLQIFSDRGFYAVRLWDSFKSTWIDADHDTYPDEGEYLRIGGWTTLPALASGRIFVGGIPPSSFGAPCTHLYSLELDRLGYVGNPISATYTGAGSTPAIVDGNLYTVGIGGLHAFGPIPPQGDVNSDGVVDSEDIHTFDANLGRRDVDLNGIVNDLDHTLLCNLVRAAEKQAEMQGGPNAR